MTVTPRRLVSRRGQLTLRLLPTPGTARREHYSLNQSDESLQERLKVEGVRSDLPSCGPAPGPGRPRRPAGAGAPGGVTGRTVTVTVTPANYE